MSRPTTKTDLLTAAEGNYEQLQALISSLTEKELAVPFDFTGKIKRKEAHWERDKKMRNYFRGEFSTGLAEARSARIL